MSGWSRWALFEVFAADAEKEVVARMAAQLEHVAKVYRRHAGRLRPRPRHPGRRADGSRRPLRLRQDDRPAHGCRLEEITDGEVRIGDRIVNDLTPKERNIAMVFQSYALYPHMTVDETSPSASSSTSCRRTRSSNASSARRGSSSRGLPEAQAARALGRPASARRDGPRDRARAGGLPDGRAALEPGREARVQMRAEIHQLQRRLDVTTIYVTHDQVEAMTMGDRVAVMNAGACSRSTLRRCSTTSR